MGQGVAEQERQTALLGIAPEAKVGYQIQPATQASNGKTQLDPNHSHFVLVKGDKFGDETETMFGLAAELAQRIPVVTVLVGGGDIAKQEVLESVRHGWPVVVLTGSDQPPH
jgi:SLOG in TRPM, prokaryote